MLLYSLEHADVLKLKDAVAPAARGERLEQCYGLCMLIEASLTQRGTFDERDHQMAQRVEPACQPPCEA